MAGAAVSSLQFDVNYSTATGGFEGSGSGVKCTKQVLTALRIVARVSDANGPVLPAEAEVDLGAISANVASLTQDLAKLFTPSPVSK